MLITKEQQESLVDNYVKEKHSTDEVCGFIDGIGKLMELIIRLDSENKIIKKSVVKNELKNEGKLIVTDSFRYETEKGCISLLKPCYFNFQSYQISCQFGDLFDDVERYNTFEEAESRIKRLLL